MDLVDVAILALRLALALVLYLFLWLVVRGAWRALRSAPTPARARASPGLRLLVLEAGGSSLPTGQVIEVRDGATLGRAERSSLVLADSTVSAEHARFGLLAGEWVVDDLGSTNGTLLNQAPVHGQTPLATGDVVAVGNVRLQVVAH